MIIKRTAEQLNEHHAQLDRGIARQEPASIALGLIRSLNQDNDCNYGFSPRQVELLSEHIKAALAQFQGSAGGQVLFTEKLIDDIASGAEHVGEGFEEICEILDDIFQCIDESGHELQQPEQPFHFDSYPFSIAK
jgi:hypothetical protein